MKYAYSRLWLMIVLAFVLTIIVLPESISSLRPCWVLLLMLYIQFMLPSVFSLVGVFIFGLVLDVLTVSPLGQHVFAFALIAWIANTRARRFKFFSMSQQMIWIGVLTFVYQLTLALLDYFLGYSVQLASFIVPVLLSICIWPLLSYSIEEFLLDRKIRKI